MFPYRDLLSKPLANVSNWVLSTWNFLVTIISINPLFFLNPKQSLTGREDLEILLGQNPLGESGRQNPLADSGIWGGEKSGDKNVRDCWRRLRWNNNGYMELEFNVFVGRFDFSKQQLKWFPFGCYELESLELGLKRKNGQWTLRNLRSTKTVQSFGLGEGKKATSY